MKKKLIILAAILSLFISARPDAASYNRSLIYIGSPQTDAEPEKVKKICGIFLEDIKKRLAPKIRFINLSEAYLYSQKADVRAIAKTNNARWIIYGKIKAAQKNTGGNPSIVMNLYDAKAGKDIESISFRANENETSKFKDNIEYIYSKIAEANGFFLAPSGKAQLKLSPEKALLFNFEIAENVPANFHRLQTAAREALFERSGSPENVYGENVRFVLMRHRDYNSMKRIKTLSRLINTRWFITGVLIKKKPDSGNIHCALRLFDAEKETIAEKIEMEAADYESMELLLKRRLQNFILTLSAETDHKRFNASLFNVNETKIPGSDTQNKQEAYSGSVFDTSGALVSGYGNIIHISTDGLLDGKIESTGKGIQKFTRSAGVQVDPQGRIYVMDTIEKKILQFHKDGSFICEFFYGTNADSFIAVSDGYVFIPDTGKQLIQVYTREGSHIRDVPIETEIPITLCLFKGNPVVISASDGLYVQTFLSQNGSVLQVRYLGISSKTLYINAAAMDVNENMYCVDSGRGMLICISKNGNILWIEKKLTPLSPDKFISPSSVSSDYMGNTLLVIDNKGKRIINMHRKSARISKPENE